MTEALIPVKQREVEFLGDPITAVIMADGDVFVPVRPIVQSLGIDWSAQWRRMRRDAVLSEEMRFVVVMATNPLLGGDPEAIALPLDYIPGFLFGISAGRIKDEEKRDRVIKYQRDCYRVLYEAMMEGRLSVGSDDDDFEQALASADPQIIAGYRTQQAILRLYRNDILIQAQVTDHGGRLDAIEALLSAGDRAVTEDQASQISQAVKAVAMKFGEQSGRNEYGGVYGELYRKFSITSYKSLPTGRFQEALNWLNEWYQALVDDVEF